MLQFSPRSSSGALHIDPPLERLNDTHMTNSKQNIFIYIYMHTWTNIDTGIAWSSILGANKVDYKPRPFFLQSHAGFYFSLSRSQSVDM